MPLHLSEWHSTYLECRPAASTIDFFLNHEADAAYLVEQVKEDTQILRSVLQTDCLIMRKSKGQRSLMIPTSFQ